MIRFTPLLSILWCASAVGVNVGDTPHFRVKTLDGHTVTPEVLSGKVTVMEFWATWCGPCIAEMPHMKKLHATYSPHGVAFLGISRDDSARAVRHFASRKDVTWPQVLDKQQQPQLAALFGTSGIPHAVILSPNGRVLWRGHPARIDQPLADAVKKHPPGRRAGADDTTDEEPAPEEATRRGPSPDPAAARAAPRPKEARGEMARRATNLLALADRQRDAGRHAGAYVTYLKIIGRHETSPAATKAEAQCLKYEANEVFMASHQRTVATKRSRSTLKLADAYRQRGKTTMAKLLYQEIIERYPDTDAAAEAAQRMRGWPGENGTQTTGRGGPAR